MLAVLTGAGCDDNGISSSPPTPGGFFVAPTTAAATSSPSGNVELPRPTAEVTAVECALDADLGLHESAISNAVGTLTYVWLSEEDAESLSESGLTPDTKTSEFEERVRLLGTADQAEALDAYLSKVNGTLTSWPRFWATRVDTLAKPHLLQVNLRPDALWLTQTADELRLVDAFGNVAPIDVPTGADLERVAGVFFASANAANDGCEAPFAKRELVLTNLDLIERWALGTDAVLAAVEAEMALVNGFATNVRKCAYPLAFDAWSSSAACVPDTLLWSDYARNLASLDQAYYPSARNLARVSDLVAADLRRWREQPLVAESAIDVADAATFSDAGSNAQDGGAVVREAGTCRVDGGESGCPVVAVDAAPSDAAVAVSDTGPEAAGPVGEADLRDANGDAQ